MIRLAIAGVAGRMGRAILNLALKDKEFTMHAGLESIECPAVGTDLGVLCGAPSLGVRVTSDLDCIQGADVLIDFTHPSVVQAHVDACVRQQVRCVIGTTGIAPATMEVIRQSSLQTGIVQSPNMSIGVNLLFKIAEITAAALDEDYDIEVVEAHHRMKKDAPSGTALKLLEILAKARKRSIEKDAVFGRQGETGARRRGEIGVLAVRGGDVVGDHTVSFMAEGERIELTHRASSRDAFAQGALKAAKFVATKKAGLYTMSQVLGIA